MSDYPKLSNEQVYRDPVYGYIHVSYKIIKDLIDSSVFQRLRRIKQLSGVYMVFHCAEHSRFGHSLGVYELANRFLEIPDLKETLNLREKLLFLVSALLHDIGHGAYSHAFEDVFLVDHEKIGAQVIKENKEIRTILDTIDSDFAMDVYSIIRKEKKYPIIEKLISSQLDVDRLDYLMRDAYFTGATYGNVDFERIIRVFRIKNGKIVYKASGIHAIENYLISRYHMYWQVYYHPSARAYELVLEMIYSRIRYLIENNYRFLANIDYLKNLMNNPKSINDYLKIDDNYINSLIATFTTEKDLIIKELANDFLNRHIWEYLDDTSNNQMEIAKIKSRFQTEEKEYYCAKRSVFQSTYKFDSDNIGNEIEILLEDGQIVTINEYSPVIYSLSSAGSKKDYKFFYRKTL